MQLIDLIVFSFVTIVTAQDCTKLLGLGKKRFVLDSFYDAWNKLPREIRNELPANTEVDAKCRFDLTDMNDSQRLMLKTLYESGYAICVGCGYTNADHGRCHSIDVCSRGSNCIRAYNRNRQPDYYWHGCCDPSDSKCGSDDVSVHFNSFGGVNLPYHKVACKGPLCNENGYTTEKDALISYLTNGSQLPSTTTAAPSAVDGNWSSWGPWSGCDQTCDIGTRTRGRSCTNPAPSGTGSTCAGDAQQLELCNAVPCS
ncbi:hypothetical protein ACF0H5_024071 [Mactra antiquata]